MKIKLITVGKTKTKHWLAAETDFEKRIKRYAEFNSVFVKEASQKSLRNDDLVKATEAKSLLLKIEPQEFVFALDKGGKQISSQGLANFLQKKNLNGINKFAFVIGGPLGLAPEVLKRADYILSLSEMTFPHELAKVVLLEQIYRAFTILNDEKYHK